jgi:hypothetical protein
MAQGGEILQSLRVLTPSLTLRVTLLKHALGIYDTPRFDQDYTSSLEIQADWPLNSISFL